MQAIASFALHCTHVAEKLSAQLPNSLRSLVLVLVDFALHCTTPERLHVGKEICPESLKGVALTAFPNQAISGFGDFFLYLLVTFLCCRRQCFMAHQAMLLETSTIGISPWFLAFGDTFIILLWLRTLPAHLQRRRRANQAEKDNGLYHHAEKCQSGTCSLLQVGKLIDSC